MIDGHPFLFYDECHCECHNLGAEHIVPCCTLCDQCRTRVRMGTMLAHHERCHPSCSKCGAPSEVEWYFVKGQCIPSRLCASCKTEVQKAGFVLRPLTEILKQ